VIRLAKPHLDIGLFTHDIEAEYHFWATRAGLRCDHRLPIEPGWVQHRFDAHGSVVKVNHLSTPLPDRPASGYARLSVAAPSPPAPWSGVSPAGAACVLVAPGDGGVTGIGITIESARPAALAEFYRTALGFEPAGPDSLRCGDTVVSIVAGAGGQDQDDVIGPGFRYLTIQVFDADHEMAGIARRGGRIVREPVSFAGVARFGFVADTDGNWIEISARTSLTGIEVS
jgi:lactoylglutathione lyase